MPQPQNCNKDDCKIGDVSLSIKAEGNNFFCEEDEAVVEIDREASLDFDYFIYYWCDGIVDTLTFADQPAKHKYVIDPEDRCNNSQSDYFVRVVGFKDCGENVTCRTVGVSLAIIYKPVAQFTAPNEVCVDTELSFSNGSCNTDEDGFLWDFGDGTTSELENPSHLYESTGNYTVTLTATNDCGSNQTSRSVRVVGKPEADFSYLIDPESGCRPAIVDFDAQTNQWSQLQWDIEPFDTLLWCFTDENMGLGTQDISVLFKAVGKYPVTLTASNACPEDDVKVDTIEIFEKPFFTINSPGSFCEPTTISPNDIDLSHGGTIDKFIWTFENGTPATFTGEEFPEVTFQQSGTIRLEIESPCEGVQPQTVPITIASIETISLANNQEEICQNADPIQLNASPTGGQWRTNNLPDDALTELGLLDPSKLSPRSYTLTYSTGTADCPNEETFDIEILEGIEASLDEVPVSCEEVTLNFNQLVSYSGGIDTYLWTFPDGTTSTQATPNNLTLNEAGSFPIIVQVSGACGQNITDTTIVEIQANVPLEIEAVDNPICTGSAPDTLRVNAMGGQWSGDLIVDQENGVYDPSTVTPNTYQVTYQLDNGACSANASVEIEVVASESVEVTDRTVCTDSSPFALEASTDGGIFSGMGVDSVAGTFDPTMVEPDEYTVTYTFNDPNGCGVKGQGTILVEDFPAITLKNPIELCLSDIDVDLNEVLDLEITPNGGNLTWSGDGITNASTGVFNAGQANLGEGDYTIRLQYERNECTVIDSVTINLIEARNLDLSKDTTICISEETLQLMTNLSGGEWDGAGIDENGLIDLVAIGGGMFPYTYEFAIGTSCEQSGALMVEVIDPKSLINAGSDIEICEGPANYILQGATPTDGLWEGTAIDPSTGNINLSQLKLDTTYTYTYCIESDQIASCGACATRKFKINAKPTADFSIDGQACIDQQFSLENNSLIADQFAWDFGDGNRSSELNPSYEYNTQGDKTITLIATTTPFNCKDTSELAVYVTTPPTATFTLDETEGCAPFTIKVDNNSFGDNISQQWLVNGDTTFGGILEDAVIDSIFSDSLFTILLSVENSCGTVYDSAKALVHPYPIVDFGISQDEDCSPAEIEFFNAILGNPDNYSWDMGNGETFSSFEPPNQIYTTTDSVISTYTVQLQASNMCGEGAKEKTITIFPPNVEAFIELDTLRGCQPFTVDLKGYATPGATTNWQIIDPEGNQMGSELNRPTVELDKPGIYTLVYYASNCGTHTDTAKIEVLAAPQVEFTHRPFICEGVPVELTNLSQNTRGSQWNFSSGDTSSAFSPTQIFDSVGIYSIQLTGFSEANNCPATFESQIEVIGNPVANFSASSTNICPNTEISFTNESEGQAPLIYNWDFGDGSSNVTESNPTHLFTKSGRFEVTLKVSDPDSCFSAVSVVDIFVYDEPIADFNIPATIYCQGKDTLFLDNISQGANSFEWRFQEEVSTAKDPFFLLAEAGTFPIFLSAENEFECVNSSQKEVTVLASPIANFATDKTEGCQELWVEMENSSQNSDSFLWNFDQEDSSTDTNPSYLFKNVGEGSIRLIANTLNGCPSDTAVANITIWEKPAADFSVQKTIECGTPAAVIFDNLSPENLDYSWTFGDGQSSEERTPDHAYDFEGPKEIELVIANEFGCKDTTQQMIDIFGQPKASALISTNIGCEDLSVNLNNVSEAALTYEWNITSFPPMTDPSPTVVFEEPGIYSVALIAIYNEFCTDTLSLPNEIRVYESPLADFRYEADLDKTVLGDVQFYNDSQAANRFQWDLGDGTVSNQVDFSHVYDINRSIAVTLVAFNDNNGAFVCTDSITKPVDPEWLTTFYAPNAFAPDLDIQKVDVFQPVGLGIQTYSIDIYSPYGQLVWHSTALEDKSPSEAWNGRLFNTGDLLPQGVYVWKVQLVYEDGNEIREVGSVTLMR